jgi:bacterioferritin (cytochrome b1)
MGGRHPIASASGSPTIHELAAFRIQNKEAHADYLKAQLSAVQQMGIGPYLAQQM